MAYVKVTARANKTCKRGTRHLKGRKGCWRKNKR
jgi:hypothetical protein